MGIKPSRQEFAPLGLDERYAQFKRMRIDHPRHLAAVEAFEALRHRKVASPQSEQGTVFLFAESQSGKSTTVDFYIEREIIAECMRREIFTPSDGLSLQMMVEIQPLVLKVKLSGNVTISKLLTDILSALGDATPSEGTIPYRNLRVLTLLRAKGVEIIIFDEAQHLKGSAYSGSRSKADDATEVQNTLKNILTGGWPIVFVGTQEAENVVFERQIRLRADEPIKYGPLQLGNDDDELDFIKFCAVLGMKLAEHGILPAPENLVANDIAADLMIAAGGRYGIACNIVRRVVDKGFARGLNKLDRRLFEEVVSEYAVSNGICTYNPFFSQITP